MAKIELKGYILTVNKPETVGEKSTPKQTIIFKVPAWRDDFGETRGQDEEWPLDIIGDNVAKFGLIRDHQGKKAKCTVYLSGNKYVRKADNTEGWMINARLGAVEVLADKPAFTPTPKESTNTSNW